MKNNALLHIKQFENDIFKNKKIQINKNDKSNNNPFQILESYISIFPNNLLSKEIENIYMSYLIIFYFAAQDTYIYLQILKNKYNDFKIKNLEQEKLLEDLKSKIKIKENNYLKEEWDKLKKEQIFIENNDLLNEKIKEYVKENDANKFLKDVSILSRIKEKKIEISHAVPKNLLIKAYWLKKGIPLNLPKELKNK